MVQTKRVIKYGLLKSHGSLFRGPSDSLEPSRVQSMTINSIYNTKFRDLFTLTYLSVGR